MNSTLATAWFESVRRTAPESLRIRRPRADSDLVRDAWIRGGAVGLLVLTVYGVINLFTATRCVPPTPLFPFEEHIPFLPGMMIPYLMLYPAFFGAFQLARRPGAAETLVHRVLLALGISAIVFLLCPFHSARVRPAVDGVAGMLVSLLSLDMPYNQAPSLHVSLSVIFAAAFRKHGSPGRRALVIPVFATIVASTLFVFQHHVLDVTTGLMLGAFCVAVVGESALDAEG